MPSRHQSAPHQRNRATGFTDADWGALEKRLSDTRDLLKDILLHLRKVLDNLKTAGTHYQSAGRAWRKAETFTQAGRRQQGHRPFGPAAGAQKPSGTAAGFNRQSTSDSTSSQHSQASSRKAGSYGSASSAGPGASASAGSANFAGAGASAGSSYRASQASGAHAGPHAGSTRQGAAGAGSQGQGQKAGQAGQTFTGSSSRASYERQAGNGFSWNQRGKAEEGARFGASAGNGAGAGQDTAGGRTTFGGARAEASGKASGKASGASGSWRREDERTREQGQERRHRTTGPGGGSSYQDYSKRNHKSPLGNGRMTLTQACALLCVSYPCSADDVRVAYRKQARRHHPDLGGDEEMMKTINQAYELALSWCSPLRSKPGSTWAA